MPLLPFQVVVVVRFVLLVLYSDVVHEVKLEKSCFFPVWGFF